MKFYVLLFFLVLHILFSQAQNASHGVISLQNELKGSQREVINYENLPGSPYMYENFIKGKVYIALRDTPIEYELNYNAFKDELEYIEDLAIYTVTNPDKIKKVEINKEILIYTTYHDYDQQAKGFFFEIIDDYISLYRREVISYRNSRKNFYNYETYDQFSSKTTLYYLSIYGNPLILIKNKKNLSQIFFNHPALTEYLKNEKIKFRSENDLKKLVVFLNDYDKAKMNKH